MAPRPTHGWARVAAAVAPRYKPSSDNSTVSAVVRTIIKVTSQRERRNGGPAVTAVEAGCRAQSSSGRGEPGGVLDTGPGVAARPPFHSMENSRGASPPTNSSTRCLSIERERGGLVERPLQCAPKRRKIEVPWAAGRAGRRRWRRELAQAALAQLSPQAAQRVAAALGRARGGRWR